MKYLIALTVREVRFSARAGMIVAVCGKMATMPDLLKHPATEHIELINGEIVGLL
jgi:formate--tetrahydrofolate ligase